MKQSIKEYILSIAVLFLYALGISMQIKAAIGQSMFNALVVTMSDLISIEVGTILNICNLIFFIIFVLLRHTRLKLEDVVQFVIIFVNGFIVNFYVYRVLNHIQLDHYGSRLIFFIIGMLIASQCLGAILALGKFRFPLESLCLQLVETTKKSLTKIRLSFDSLFLVSAILLSLIFKLPLNIREGSIISYCLLSVSMGYSYRWVSNLMGRK